MNRERTALVLGAYGLVGREVTRGLLSRTDLPVIAAGRRRAKLDEIEAESRTTRLRTVAIDTTDLDAVRGACARAGLVINCVGPYAIGGAEIARAAIESNASCIDFANEQIHYLRMCELDAAAKERGLFALTAAGLIPGISTLLMLRAAELLPGAEMMESFYAEGRRPDAEAGLGSLMSGVIESGFQPKAYADGGFVSFRIGSSAKYVDLPEPFGRTYTLAVPGIDILIVPGRIPLRRIQTSFGMVKPPPGFFALTRMLKPHKHPNVYSLLKHVVSTMNNVEYQHALKKGMGPEGVLKITAQRKDQYVSLHVIVPNGGIGAAVMPVAAAGMWEEGCIER
jgi:hypothetical protein